MLRLLSTRIASPNHNPVVAHLRATRVSWAEHLAEIGEEEWSPNHFLLPLLLPGFQQMDPDLAHPSLQGADL